MTPENRNTLLTVFGILVFALGMYVGFKCGQTDQKQQSKYQIKINSTLKNHCMHVVYTLVDNERVVSVIPMERDPVLDSIITSDNQ